MDEVIEPLAAHGEGAHGKTVHKALLGVVHRAALNEIHHGLGKHFRVDYGEKSPDGKRFVKNQEIRDAFAQTNAYSDLFMELATDAKAAAAFVNGVIQQPKKAPAPAPQN